MFGSIGGPELLLILALAFLLFGPRKLPEIGRSLGKALAEFRRATWEFRTGLEREVDHERKALTEVKDAVSGAIPRAGSGAAPSDDVGSGG